ncbi:MAG: hypothetical protein OET18_03555 [Desulfobacterales bacterium]|nr:hypothetical protein [Desulfobacterales bacterium]
MRHGNMGCEAQTAVVRGAGLSHEIHKDVKAEVVPRTEGSMSIFDNARGCHFAGV